MKHPLHDKYPSIANLSNPNQMMIFINEFPELKECLWTVEEKYHGFNFQVTYFPGTNNGYEPDYAGSRDIQVARETEFYGAWATIDRYKDEFAKLREASNITNSKLTIYLEMFGGKVSRGIRYDVPVGAYKIRFIGIKVNGEFLAPEAFYNFMLVAGIPNNMVALPIAIVKGIHEAVAFNPVFRSGEAASGSQGNFDAEGVVIKPYQKHYVNKGGHSILIKLKNPRFAECALEKKVREVNPKVEELREIWKTFLNDNRIQSAFSKIGPITSKQQIAYYIKYITIDAKSDFETQYEETFSILSADDQRSVLNVGGHLSNQLLAYIQEVA